MNQGWTWGKRSNIQLVTNNLEYVYVYDNEVMVIVQYVKMRINVRWQCHFTSILYYNIPSNYLHYTITMHMPRNYTLRLNYSVCMQVNYK
jgi:hypothetical protein